MHPTLYTFRRCPYAMRARWAIQVAGVDVEKHEVALRNKPDSMLAASPKGTVPVLVLPEGGVIDQSLDIMLWALAQNDPEQWLSPGDGTLPDMLKLIEACEREFKPHLDRYKYPSRYQTEWAGEGNAYPQGVSTVDQERSFSDTHFAAAQQFLEMLALRLSICPALAGQAPALADFAIVPFVRQMARHDRVRFDKTMPRSIIQWMDILVGRPEFELVMKKPG